MRRKNVRVRAQFLPEVPEALVSEVALLVGVEAEFIYVRKMDDDEPYPDEWILQADDPRFAGYNIPERDLKIVPGEASAHSP